MCVFLFSWREVGSFVLKACALEGDKTITEDITTQHGEGKATNVYKNILEIIMRNPCASHCC